MRCRTIVLLCLALGLLAAPLPAEARPAEQVRCIGYLAGGRGGGSGQYLLDAFQHGLRELGWVEGQNLVIEWRLTRGRNELFPDFAAELVRLGVEVIVVGGGEPVVRVAQHATSTIPIVMAVSAAPVEAGLVASLAQPGGNVTGLSIQAVAHVPRKISWRVSYAFGRGSASSHSTSSQNPGKMTERNMRLCSSGVSA